MVQRTAIFLLLVVGVSATPAQATPVQFDFTIDFQPSIITDPAFADGVFRGTASFFLDNGAQGLDLISGEEIHTDKYGRVKVQFHWDRKGKNTGDDSSIPCDPGCAFDFGFSGFASGFPAFAFADTGELPGAAPGPPPILPIGLFISGGPPIDRVGRIVAYDAPIQIGTWDLRISDATPVPEPGTCVLLGTGLAALCGRVRRNRRRAIPEIKSARLP